MCVEEKEAVLHEHVVVAQPHVARHAHVHHNKLVVLPQREPRRHHLLLALLCFVPSFNLSALSFVPSVLACLLFMLVAMLM